jgi:hypothetical protein
MKIKNLLLNLKDVLKDIIDNFSGYVVVFFLPALLFWFVFTRHTYVVEMTIDGNFVGATSGAISQKGESPVSWDPSDKRTWDQIAWLGVPAQMNFFGIGEGTMTIACTKGLYNNKTEYKMSGEVRIRHSCW